MTSLIVYPLIILLWLTFMSKEKIPLEEIQFTALWALSWLLIKWQEQTLAGLIINPVFQAPSVHSHHSFQFLLPT